MRLLSFSKRYKSTSTLPAVFSDANSLYSPYPRASQQGTLALPTRLDEVAGSVHETIPQQLPGDQATEDEVRYFLYQILTFKDYKLASKNPQWVLETCMLWQGGGSKLNRLPAESFNLLCPLRPGYAMIDWSVKRSKFIRQQLPPCGVRDEIGRRIREIVEGLKRKEEGHRSPGWQDSANTKPTTRQLYGMQPVNSPTEPGYVIFPSAPTRGHPTEDQFYSLGNRSLPVFHPLSPSHPQQNPRLLHRQSSLSTLQYEGLQVIPPPQIYGAQGNPSPQINGNSSADISPMSSPESPNSSCFRTASTSSRLSTSTVKTSPPNSESEHPDWTSRVDRPPSAMSRTADSHRSSRTRGPPSATPSRYRNPPLKPSLQYDERAFHPAHHMAHLRSPSYAGHSAYARSEASLTPSDSATVRHGRIHSVFLPEDIVERSLRRRPSCPTVESFSSRSSIPQSIVTALPYSQVPSRLGTATPAARNEGSLVRPINNYKVDAHALDAAEHIGLKSSSGVLRSMMADEERRRNLNQVLSDSGPRMRPEGMVSSVPNRQEPVGPLLRFQNPRTGEPRLTIYETIEQKEKLGKHSLENQRRLEIQHGHLKTVYETIEEQELLDGKPQRGADSCVNRRWGKYFT